MHAERASLSLLTVSPANRIAMHRHPGAEVLYVLKGHTRVIGLQDTTPEKVDEGRRSSSPPTCPHALENMGRSAPALIIQIFAPLGPERVYRDSKDEAGRAAFEVIRDPRQAIAPEGARIVAMPAAKGTAHSIAGGKATARVLFDEESIGSRDIYVGLVEVEGGAEIARHSHAGGEELFYVLSGDGGELTVGIDKIALAPSRRFTCPRTSRTRSSSTATARR